MEALNAVLPAAWSHNNPIDIIGDAAARAVRARRSRSPPRDPRRRRPAGDPDAPGDDRPDRDRRAAGAATPSIEGKPVLASWMGGDDVAEGAAILRAAGIPTFAYPDTAARAVQLHVALQPTTCARSTRRRRCRRRPSDGASTATRAEAIIDGVRARAGGRC